jgi:hypothetical protein
MKAITERSERENEKQLLAVTMDYETIDAEE